MTENFNIEFQQKSNKYYLSLLANLDSSSINASNTESNISNINNNSSQMKKHIVLNNLLKRRNDLKHNSNLIDPFEREKQRFNYMIEHVDHNKKPRKKDMCLFSLKLNTKERFVKHI